MRYFLVLIVALFLSTTMSTSSTVDAQVHFGISLNLNTQPAWGPTGYDYVENYYLPDIDVYYNVPQHRYFYYNRGRWISSSYLPSRYRNFDIYNSYKVVVNERNPWRNNETYREKYSSFKGRRDQQPIRDSRDSKYFANKYHPEHSNWVKQQKNDNSNRNDMKYGNNGKGNNKNQNDNQRNNQNKQNHEKNKK
ncbi:MAG: hypothetical protein ACYC4T_00775 [Melioribacteraceae bacterium]